MKIRRGHVTNSSSSSYIVAIDKATPDNEPTLFGGEGKYEPQTWEELIEYRGNILITEEEYNELVAQGCHFLSGSLGGDGSYDGGEIEFLLRQGGIKYVKEIYHSGDY